MSLNVTVEYNNVKWYGFQFRKKLLYTAVINILYADC
mgnify:FL=1